MPGRLYHPAPGDYPLRLGRDTSCPIHFEDPHVSRLHAEIRTDGDNYILQDLGSRTGTRVNGSPIEAVHLQDKDIVEIGLERLRVMVDRSGLMLLLEQGGGTTVEADPAKPILVGGAPECGYVVDVPGLPAEMLQASPRSDGRWVLSPRVPLFLEGKKVRSWALSPGEGVYLPGCLLRNQGGKLFLDPRKSGFPIRFQNVGLDGSSQRILDDQTLSIEAGSLVALLGISGQGKSSMLRLMSGVLSPSQGSVLVDGCVPSERGLRERIAYLRQDPPLRHWLRVEETLQLALVLRPLRKLSPAERTERIHALLEDAGLLHRQKALVSTLSGGERRRLALAAELASHPGLLLLDEPTAGLDPVGAAKMVSQLQRTAAQGRTVVVATHDYELISRFDQVLLIHGGHLVFAGTPSAAMNHFGADFPSQLPERISSAPPWTNPVEASEQGQASNPDNAPRPHLRLAPRARLLPRQQWLLWWRSLVRDRGRAISVALQPFLVGFCLWSVFAHGGSSWNAAFALVLASSWFALSASLREFSEERRILLEELRLGASPAMGVAVRLLGITVLSTLQSLLSWSVFGPAMGLAPHLPELLLVLIASTMATAALGLSAGSFCRTPAQSSTALPLLLVPLAAFAGALVPGDSMRSPGRLTSLASVSSYAYRSLRDTLSGMSPSGNDIEAMLVLAVVFSIISTVSLVHARRRPDAG